MLADTLSTFISWGIGLGALIALGFELWGVARNAEGKGHGMETITEYVRWGVKHSVVVKVLVAVFCISLLGHFLWGWWLLP